MMPNFPKSFKPFIEEEQKKESPKFPSSFKPVAEGIDLRPQREKDEELIWEDSGDIERQEERGRTQATSRIAEGFLGTPGNIQSALKGITGLQFGTQLPTTSDIKKFSEKASLGYTKPQTKFEEETGEILNDIGAMAVPGAASYSSLRNIGIPIAGWMAKEGLEKIGASEGSGQVAKIATMVALDLASAYSTKGRGGAKNYAKELWKEGESNIPKGATINATKLEADLVNLKNTIQKGGSTASDSPALTKIDELLQRIKNGNIDVDELVAARVKINDIISANGGFDWASHPTVKQGSVNKLNQVKDKIIETLDDYGKTNPAFGVPYNKGNEAYSVYHASNLVSRFLKKNFGDYISSPVLYKIFKISGKTVAASALPGAATTQGVKLLYRIWKSPTLRELYGNVMKAAFDNNKSVAAKNLSELQKKLKEEEPNFEETNKSPGQK